jgi:DNA-binding transcriptional ArsR family regulator
MKKNIQSLELVLPNLIFEEKKKVTKLHEIFDLLQVNDKLNRTPTFTFNFNANNIEEDNHKPLQPLKYQHNDSNNNEESSLLLLSEEEWSTYSFKALERKLGIHQQSLSRALKRLEYLNLVEKTPYGYKIKGKNIFPIISIIQNNQLEEQEEPLSFETTTTTTKKTKKRFNQLIQIRIPIKSNIDIIVNRLVGKWFGNLRWLGLVKKEAGFTLQWTAINRYTSSSNSSNYNLFQINLNIVSEYIVIETDAISDKAKIDAMSYSNRLVEEITKILQSNIKEEEEYKMPEEFTIPKKYSSTYTNKIKYKSNKINK